MYKIIITNQIRCHTEEYELDESRERDRPPVCTSCKRAGGSCSFSRIPMKRGPSKRQRSYSMNSTGSTGSSAGGGSTTGQLPNTSSPSMGVMSFSIMKPENNTKGSNKNSKTKDIGATSPTTITTTTTTAFQQSPKPMERLPGIGSITNDNPHIPPLSGLPGGLNLKLSIPGSGSDHNKQVYNQGPSPIRYQEQNTPSWPPAPLQSLPTPPPPGSVPLMTGPSGAANADGSNGPPPQVGHTQLGMNSSSYFVKAGPAFGRDMSHSDSNTASSVASNASPRSESSNLCNSPRFSPGSGSASNSGSVVVGRSPRFSPNINLMNGSHSPGQETTPNMVGGAQTHGVNLLTCPNTPPDRASEQQLSSQMGSGLFHWDDRCIDAYYRTIHPTLPILPPNRGQLRARLMSCPDRDLQSTFWAILTTCVKKQPGYLTVAISGAGAGANSSNNNNSPRISQPINTSALLFPKLDSGNGQVLRLTCLILLYLDSRSSLILAAACTLASEMRLHEAVAASYMDDEARRLFLILVILDRLHAAINPHMRLSIAEEHIVLDAQNDTRCFNGSQASFELVRLALFLGQVTAQTQKSPISATASFSSWPPAVQLEELGRNLETMWDTAPVLRAVYCFARLVLARKVGLGSQSVKSVQAGDALSLVFVIENPLVCVSPLMPHFATVLNETLCLLVGAPGETAKSDSDLKSNGRGATSNSPDPRLAQLVDVIKHVILQQSPQLLPLLQQGLSVVSDMLGQQRLEGLAAVAHAHANGHTLVD